MPNKIFKTYFEDIYAPLKFQHENTKHGLKCKVACSKVSFDRTPKDQVTRLFRAIKDVSRETQHGIILEQLQAGLITDYDANELDIAYELYKEVVDFDIKNEEVKMDILKLARDPKTALDNVVERVDALDTDQIPTPKD